MWSKKGNRVFDPSYTQIKCWLEKKHKISIWPFLMNLQSLSWYEKNASPDVWSRANWWWPESIFQTCLARFMAEYHAQLKPCTQFRWMNPWQSYPILPLSPQVNDHFVNVFYFLSEALYFISTNSTWIQWPERDLNVFQVPPSLRRPSRCFILKVEMDFGTSHGSIRPLADEGRKWLSVCMLHYALKRP